MNRFSFSQYFLIITVLVLGFIYALPNLYPTQPSIQLAYTDTGKSADQSLLNEIQNTLDEINVEYDEILLRDNKIVLKFQNIDQQRFISDSSAYT